MPILALDIPTGVDADTGVAQVSAIRATATATFIALKPGLLTGDGVDFCGAVSVHALGIEPEGEPPAVGHRLDWHTLTADKPAAFLRHARNVHKCTFGTLAIVGGADSMVGRAAVGGRAALHAGTGKVWVGLIAGEPPRRLEPAGIDVAHGRAGTRWRNECDCLRTGAGRFAGREESLWPRRLPGTFLWFSTPTRSTRLPRTRRSQRR
jgi:hypothetical protein